MRAGAARCEAGGLVTRSRITPLTPPLCSIASGSVKVGDPLVAMDLTGLKTEEGKVTRLFARRGMAAIPLERATAGDIVQLAGLSTPVPTSTVAAPSITRPLFATPLDPPTLSMCFGVNDSPLGGKDGTQLTGTMISERLQKEAASNIALQVMPAVAQEVRGSVAAWGSGGAEAWVGLAVGQWWRAPAVRGSHAPSSPLDPPSSRPPMPACRACPTPWRCAAAASCRWLCSSRTCAARASSFRCRRPPCCLEWTRRATR